MIDFNKAAYTNAFKNMNTLQEQAEKVINQYIDQAVGMSDESKTAAKEWIVMYRKGCEDFQKLVSENLKKVEVLFLVK